MKFTILLTLVRFRLLPRSFGVVVLQIADARAARLRREGKEQEAAALEARCLRALGWG